MRRGAQHAHAPDTSVRARLTMYARRGSLSNPALPAGCRDGCHTLTLLHHRPGHDRECMHDYRKQDTDHDRAMKKEIDFKAWLEQGGASSAAAQNTRTFAVRTIERKLDELETPFRDLDEAWEADRFESLSERLRHMREDARNGGQDYRILMPNSENPLKRLSSWRSWLGQYGRFLDDEPPGSAKDTDRIRQYVLEHYIEPAREEGRRQAEVLVRDVNEALGLNEAWPNICQVLAGNKFQELAQVPPPERIGAVQSSATVFRFDLSDHRVDRSALDQLRDRFLSACPDFRNFVDPGTGWARDEKAYKVAASERVRAALEEGGDEEALGKAVFEILKTAAKDAPFVRWQTEDTIAKQYSELLGEFHAVIGQLIQSDQPAEAVLLQAYDSLDALKKRGAASLTYGERINILFSALSMVRPLEAASIKITRINEAWVKLTGKKLFVEATADMESDYRRFADVFSELFSIMRDDWRWQPQDWIDIQGFLWIATEPLETDVSTNTSNNRGKSMPISPTNLILYGPPGTGKTYSTAEEAIRLCGEQVPEGREALMLTYQRLLAARRIEFVTFHQSMSYEDFVEGRQPMTGSDEEDASSTGFRLETVPGIFRRIAMRAETSRGRSTGGNAITIADRKVFKMSIGEANNPEDVYLFEEAIDGGYALLGFEDIDWSDDKYADWEAIIEACKTKGHTDIDARSGVVQMPFIFRNRVHQGDIVIVSKGNSLFRAIGEFTGDYEYHPRPNDDYAHRRTVRWHWWVREGVPVSEIYTQRFMQKPIYQIPKEGLNILALERYLNSQQADGPAEPEPFVLIIDEINRANISKVFGELITLLEPDKRLDQPNVLKIRLPYSGDDFGVPSNLHILGTMNTADRSIALLDTALRRRFTFREVMPDPSLLAGEAGTCGIDLPRILATINERIEYLYDREHQIGHAYFTGCASRADVDAVMRYKAIPLLAEYFFEDWEKIAAVLGDAVSNDGPITGGFLKRSVLKSPPGIEDGDALPRFRWEVRSEAEGFDYTGLTEA